MSNINSALAGSGSGESTKRRRPVPAQPTSAALVDLYRMLYNSDNPLRFEEIVNQMPSAYQNDANRWWIEQNKKPTGPVTIKPEPWSTEDLRTVKADWISDLLGRAVKDKWAFSRRAGDDPSLPIGNTPREQLVFTANPNKRPYVRSQVDAIVEWTPEIGAAGRRHVKGIQFRDALAEIEAKGRLEVKGRHRSESKATKQELEAALELAAEALGYGRRFDADD
jgi:hypothetical protein